MKFNNTRMEDGGWVSVTSIAVADGVVSNTKL